MNAKTLIVFCVLLIYYSYLCDICGTINDGQACSRQLGYDANGIYRCQWDIIVKEICYRTQVNFKISSCESAFDDIIKSIQNPTILCNIDIGSCGYINNNCYYEGINAI